MLWHIILEVLQQQKLFTSVAMTRYSLHQGPNQLCSVLLIAVTVSIFRSYVDHYICLSICLFNNTLTCSEVAK